MYDTTTPKESAAEKDFKSNDYDAPITAEKRFIIGGEKLKQYIDRASTQINNLGVKAYNYLSHTWKSSGVPMLNLIKSKAQDMRESVKQSRLKQAQEREEFAAMSAEDQEYARIMKNERSQNKFLKTLRLQMNWYQKLRLRFMNPEQKYNYIYSKFGTGAANAYVDINGIDTTPIKSDGLSRIERKSDIHSLNSKMEFDLSSFDKLIKTYKKRPPVGGWDRLNFGTGQKGMIGDTSKDAKSNGTLLRQHIADDKKFYAYMVALGKISIEEAMAKLTPQKNNPLDERSAQKAKPYLGETINQLNPEEQRLSDAWESFGKPEQSQEIIFMRSPNVDKHKKVAPGIIYSLADTGSEHAKDQAIKGDVITFKRDDGRYQQFQVIEVGEAGLPTKVRLNNEKKITP